MSRVIYLTAFFATSLFLSKALAVEVTLPNVNATSGGNFVVPVLVSDIAAPGIRAAQFELVYDPALMTATGVSTQSTLSEGWLAAHKVFEGGILRVAMASAMEKTGAGTLVNLLFHATDTAEGSTALTMPEVFLGKTPPSSLSVGTVTISATPATINVPINLTAGWNLVSVPFEGTVTGGTSILAGYTWDATAQQFVHATPAQIIASVPVITGGFAFAQTAETVTISGDPSSSTARFGMTLLRPGWNIIGAPAAMNQALTFAELVSAEPDWAQVSGSSVVAYDAGTESYSSTTGTLEPGRGYWVYNPTANDLTLRLPQQRDLLFNAPASRVRASATESSLRLRLTLEGGKQRHLELGQRGDAENGFDRFDIPMPPAAPNDSQTSFQIESGDVIGPLLKSVKPEGSQPATWTIHAALDKPASLRWSSDTLGFIRPLLIEVDGTRYELLTGQPILLDAGVHRLTVRFLSRPETTRLLANYPNPFNPETWIPFELSEDSDVTVRIFDVNGTLVRTLNLGNQPQGVYASRSKAAFWDGKNAQGERVASGVYIYELTAGKSRAMRRMLVLK